VARILVRPDWIKIIQPVDREYIETTLSDLVDRSHIDPEALMSQLASLGVGPLVTADAGENLNADPSLLALAEQFEEYID
jgi:hypothetical protein